MIYLFYISWGLIGLLTFIFGAASLAKIFQTKRIIQTFQMFGYSKGFALGVGLVEFVAVAGLYFQSTRTVSLMVLFVVVGGALFSHWNIKQSVKEMTPAFVALALLLLLSFILP
ncbi:MAG TPA: hypothetical protein DCM08_00785 [Microscillaceae bacterium]|jgi:hypothetical protein|nr:hypothetical protein [Microscillaceae bacterium]